MGRTQKRIADIVSRELGIPIRQGRQFLTRVVDLMADDIVYTGRLELRGVGTFTVRDRKPRKGTHPGTGKPIQIPAKKVVRFRTSVQIDRRLNRP